MERHDLLEESMESPNNVNAQAEARPERPSRRLRRRRRATYRQNDGFSSSESESEESSATSGYNSHNSSVRDLSDLLDPEADEAALVYENTQPLMHTLEYILCVREMCDVTFLVGRKKEPIHGLQAVMATRSRHFHQMFLSHKRKALKASEEKRGVLSFFRRLSKSGSEPRPASADSQPDHHLTIPVPDYDDLVFRRLVTYLHCGHVTVTSETVTGLICAATDFELDDLRKACWEFVDRCLTSGNLETIVTSGKMYKKRPHVKLLLKMISKIRT